MISKDQHDTDINDMKFKIQAIEKSSESDKKILASKFEEQLNLKDADMAAIKRSYK